jgi:hypothetical protein
VAAFSGCEISKAGTGYTLVATSGTLTKATSSAFDVSPSISSLFTLGMAGIDLTASSSASPAQQYFAEFNLMGPVHWAGPKCSKKVVEKDSQGRVVKVRDKDGKEVPAMVYEDKQDRNPLESRCWVWADPRIASVPTPKTSGISSLTSTTTAFSGLGQQTLGGITQSLELQAGVEFYHIRAIDGVPLGDKTSLSLSYVGGGSLVTPFNPTTAAPEFDLNPNLALQFQQDEMQHKPTISAEFPQLAAALKSCVPSSSSTTSATTCPGQQQHVAFVLPSRSRFYRSYYAGVRFRTFYFTEDCKGNFKSCTPADTFPGRLDVLFGQDETVNAGHLRGMVLTLSGNVPLFLSKITWLRIFGSAHLRLARNKNLPSLALVPTSTFVPLNDTSVVIQPVMPADQDYFRIGVGIDMIQAFKSATTAKK